MHGNKNSTGTKKDMQTDRRSRNKSTQLQPYEFFDKGAKNICWKKASINGAEKTRYQHVED
jgi:hypothetical protein